MPFTKQTYRLTDRSPPYIHRFEHLLVLLLLSLLFSFLSQPLLRPSRPKKRARLKAKASRNRKNVIQSSAPTGRCGVEGFEGGCKLFFLVLFSYIRAARKNIAHRNHHLHMYPHPSDWDRDWIGLDRIVATHRVDCTDPLKDRRRPSEEPRDLRCGRIAHGRLAGERVGDCECFCQKP